MIPMILIMLTPGTQMRKTRKRKKGFEKKKISKGGRIKRLESKS